MGRSFQLAVGQAPADLASPRDRLNWLSDHLPEVAAKGADLLLLPELFATGYNIGDQIIARAEPADGPFAQGIAALAQAHRVAIHYGYAEVDGDTIYNSAQCMGPDGAKLGAHRKLLIPPGFERDYFTPGSGCTLFGYRGVQIAMLICYDAEFPETVRHVASLGAELVLVPTALGDQWAWVSQRMIPSRAYENGIFVAYANSAGAEHGMKFLGQSFIASPFGKELARATAEPAIIYGALQLDLVAKAQTRLPYLKDREALTPDII
jgi:predicted amidohydrolase